MTQAFEIVTQFHEGPEAGKTRYLAFNDVTRFMRCDKIVPRVGFQVFDRQRHSPVLRIDSGYDRIDLLSLLQHFSGMLHATRPGDIGDMHETVHTVFNLDESAEIG